jgi:crotonobetainyl-CoA:carnitine CoA-transferase CaiB-like acyl-CoA transferase
MGAQVYKIEPNKKELADVGRSFAPLYQDTSLIFATFNRNKNFLTLNLKNKRGQDLFKQMVEKADVVLNNYRPAQWKN